jgi:glycosyltransferase involved in cell wall biosynthesis
VIARWRKLRHLASRYSAAGRTRLARSLPPAARTRVRSLLARCDLRPAPRAEGWALPLIAASPPPAGGPPARQPLPDLPPAGHPPAGQPLAARPDGPGAATAVRPREPVPPAASRPAGSAPAAAGRAGPRCLIVTSHLDIGGLAAVAAFLARELPGHGLFTALLDVRPGPAGDGQPSNPPGRQLAAGGIEVHQTSPDQAARWIAQWRPDVLSLHGALPPGILTAAGQLAVPCVETLHGMHDLFRADWQAEAARSARLAAIVCVSELVRQQYQAGNASFPADRIVTIPNGICDPPAAPGDRVAARRRLGLTDEYLFVSLARHCLQKNPYGLLRAFTELARHRPEAHLVIAGRIGDSRYFRNLLRLRASLPCASRIHLRDNTPAPGSLLAAADGFVLDSFFEGWSLAPMEALCAGVPVVLSEVGGAREQVADDPARGFLVGNPAGDPRQVDWEQVAAARYRPQPNRDQVAAAMDRLIADRAGYLAGRARLAAESTARFSSATCAARHAAILRAAATGAPLPCPQSLAAGQAS